MISHPNGLSIWELLHFEELLKSDMPHLEKKSWKTKQTAEAGED